MTDVPQVGDKGVRFDGPPPDLIPGIRASIQHAIEQTGGADVALVAVADRKGGWNSALVAKVGEENDKFGGLQVVTWIGKEWGNDNVLDYGAKLIWSKKF